MFRSKASRFPDTRSLKIKNTPNDPQYYLLHLTSQVSCIHWILIPEVQISPASFKIQSTGENRKCTHWPQNHLKHLTVESTLYILNTHPWGPNFTPFCSTNSWGFFRYNVVKNHQMTLEWPQAPNCQKYPVYTEYLPWGANFTLFRSTASHFRDTSVLKIGNAPNDLEWP